MQLREIIVSKGSYLTATTAPSMQLLRLPGSHFRVWPWACVRAAGFAADQVLSIAAPQTATMIDETLDTIGPAPVDPTRRVLLAKEFDAETLRISVQLRSIAGQSRFREAVAWQNRHALRTGLDSLRGKPVEMSNAKTRAKERMVASYLQRYCVKNDSIGFFGPVGWARVTSRPEAMRVHPGAGLVSHRTVYFEHWCLDALTAKLSQDPDLLRWAPPRFAPYFRLTERTLHLPLGGTVELTEGQAAVLRSLDGETPASELAARLALDPTLQLTEDAVYAFLEQARTMGVIAWDFAVALQLHPERALRELLEQIRDPAMRSRAMMPLDALDTARMRVAAAAGDADALDREMEQLETTFQEVTGIRPTRAEGQTYAARTLVYEDCRRDAEVEIGTDLLEKLGPPLDLLLTGARWVLHRIGMRYQEALEGLFQRLSPDGRPVDLIVLHKAFAESEPSFADRGASLSATVREVQQELQTRWQEILRPSMNERCMTYTTSDLMPFVRRTFAAPCAAWNHGRYISPDIMIDATSVDAIRRGDFQIVLGEVHLFNTLAASALVAQHPDPRQLQRQVEQDLGPGNVIPVIPKSEWSQRVASGLVTPRDYRYTFTLDPCLAPPDRTLRIADLVAARKDGRLVVETRDGQTCYDALEFMGSILSLLSANAFQVLPSCEHTPRVVFDSVVVARESWNLLAASMEFAKVADPLDRWIGARRWKKTVGLPRYMFIKSPIERKPSFVDLDSPIYVDMLAKVIRQTAEADAKHRIRFSEMLPDFNHLWLTDTNGARYTSEIRMVFVDKNS